MLREFFNTCSQDDEEKTYLYKEFLEYYVWNKHDKCWNKGKSREVIDLVNKANPFEEDRCYLRLLLNHAKGPTYFQDLLTYNSV